MSPKPYIGEKCNACDFATANKNSLKMHMKLKHTVTGRAGKKQKTLENNQSFKILNKSKDPMKLTVRRSGLRSKIDRLPAYDDVSLLEIYDADSESEEEVLTTLEERPQVTKNDEKDRSFRCAKCGTNFVTMEQLKSQ